MRIVTSRSSVRALCSVLVVVAGILWLWLVGACKTRSSRLERVLGGSGCEPSKSYGCTSRWRGKGCPGPLSTDHCHMSNQARTEGTPPHTATSLLIFSGIVFQGPSTTTHWCHIPVIAFSWRRSWRTCTHALARSLTHSPTHPPTHSPCTLVANSTGFGTASPFMISLRHFGECNKGMKLFNARLWAGLRQRAVVNRQRSTDD